MAEFHEIGSSQFTDVTPTGTEQIQISATQKTTLQKIANLFKGKADPNNLVITDFNDSAPFSDGTQNTKVKFFVANAATVVNGPSNTGITSGSYYGIAIATGLMPTIGRVEYLLWVQGKKTLFRGYKVYISGNITQSGWEEVSGGGSLSDSRISGWLPITKYGDVQDPNIQNGDTLVDALRKLQWMTGNNTVKTFGDSSGIGMIWWNGDTQDDLFTAFYLEIETHVIYFLFEAPFSDLGGDYAIEDQIISYIINKGSEVYIGTTNLINYTSGNVAVRNLSGKESLWYTGSSNPTLTLLEPTFDDLNPTASLICAYNITPTFSKQYSKSVIHMHQNAADVAPTSGYKVYTIFCQVVGSVKHFFINVAPYN